MRFTSEKFYSVQATFPPGTQAPPITKVLGKMWREMTRDQKKPYVEAMDADIARRLKERDELVASRPVRKGQNQGFLIQSRDGPWRNSAVYHIYSELL